MNSIALVGFMCSGKSTTALKLLEKLKNYKLFSIDKEIENCTQLTISEIFNKYNEGYFRNLENQIIDKITTSNNGNFILDLGGGAFIQENNRKLLQDKKIKTIFLDVSFEKICKRLITQNQTRPLLSENDWKAKAKKLFNERYNIYKTADITIKIYNEESPILIAEKIIKEI